MAKLVTKIRAKQDGSQHLDQTMEQSLQSTISHKNTEKKQSTYQSDYASSDRRSEFVSKEVKDFKSKRHNLFKLKSETLTLKDNESFEDGKSPWLPNQKHYKKGD